MMPFRRSMLLVCLLSASALASAQTRILAAVPKSRSALELYAQPGDAQAARSVPVSQLPFPLDVAEIRSNHAAVQIDGKTLWVRTGQVRLSRESKAACPTAVAVLTPGLGTPGVSSAACE